MSNKKVNLGMIGLGNISRTHMKNIFGGSCPEIHLAAVCDNNPAQLQAAKEYINKSLSDAAQKGMEFEVPVYFDNADEMIASGIIDALIVCIPHYAHAEYTIKGLRAGLHVMCEKPAGVFTGQALAMAREADAHPNLYFGMMFNQRTNPAYRKMREIIAGGTLGEIRRTSWIITDWYRPAAYYRSGGWRASYSGEGGGVLLNQCPHNLDLWQWICSMPVTVDAHMKFGKWQDIEVEDDVSVYVEYKNGATGTFVTTTGDAPGTNRFEIVCDGGTLLCDSKTLTLSKLEVPIPEFSRTNEKHFGSPKATVSTVPTDGEYTKHAGVLNAFAGAILRGEPLIADGREGIFGLTLSNAMHLSAWTGKEVTLPFDASLFTDELERRVMTSDEKYRLAALECIKEYR